MKLNEYIVVRKKNNQEQLITELVSAPSKKALREYYKDWDSDTPSTTYRTLLIKKVKESK